MNKEKISPENYIDHSLSDSSWIGNTVNLKIEHLLFPIVEQSNWSLRTRWLLEWLKTDIVKFQLLLKTFGLENVTKLPNGSLKIKYPKWTYTPKNIFNQWWVWFTHFLDHKKNNSNSEHLRFSYSLKFDENFDFVKWWKLPWICGWDCPTWGNNSENWFSSRFMWRKDGELEIYFYGPERTSPYGESINRGMIKLETDTEYNLSQEIILNTPWKHDGILIVRVDNKEIYRNSNMFYRSISNKNIFADKVLFQTFFWWWDTSWATPHDTYIIIDDIKVGYFPKDNS